MKLIVTVARGKPQGRPTRASPEPANRRLLDGTAVASAMSTSGFVLTHATVAAREVLADRTIFVLPDDRWDAFVHLLEREDRLMPGHAAFLDRPSAYTTPRLLAKRSNAAAPSASMIRWGSGSA